jgi:type IV pilus assembly protein PilX
MPITLYTQGRAYRPRQKGVVLLITLIMLVAMTLAAIALMRSVDTSNLVAGNMAFQQSSLNIADQGTEQAITYLYTVPNLSCDGSIPTNLCANGYKSYHQPNLEPPTAGVTWEKYWSSMVGGPGVQPITGLPSGYTGAFIIEAMCASPQRLNCTTASVVATTTSPQGEDMGSTNRDFSNSTTTTTAYYYRITTRIAGPRNSVGYVQVIIAAQ